MMLPAISVVQEIASLYFINSADGVLTSSDVNMYYGITGFNLVVSAANAMMMKSAKKGKKDGKPEMDGQWDDQQKEGGDRPPKDGDKPPKPDGGSDGYYNGVRKEDKESSRVHQLSSAACDQVWQVLAGLQVHPQDSPRWPSQACDHLQQLPSSA